MTHELPDIDPATPVRRFFLSLTGFSRLQGMTFFNDVIALTPDKLPIEGMTPEVLYGYIEAKRRQTGLEAVVLLGVIELTRSTAGEVEQQNREAQMAKLLNGKGINGANS